jgi:nucleoside-diphosphate-sugar epimerase
MTEGVTPEKPKTLYGTAKLAHHAMLMESARQFEFTAATARIFFGYGPYENSKRIIPYACQCLGRNDRAEFSSANFYRDFMHVDDIGHGLIALIDSDLEGACNVSSGIPTRLADVIEMIGQLSGNKSNIFIGALADRPDDPPMLVGDNRRLRSTGWAPRKSLAEGLAETYAWWTSRLLRSDP